MLYDILIIDDVLGENFVGQELEATSDFNDKYLDFVRCQRLINEFIRERLRVTWTTGELDDIRNLKVQDLSTIQHIFLDLHLAGINANDSYKSINSKILGIFAEINELLKSSMIICHLNSKYRSGKNYAEEGRKDLENKFHEKFGYKYSIQVVEEKNSLSDTQKNNLVDYSLKLYVRNLIINKAAHVESIFDEKLKLTPSAIARLAFHDKFLVFQSQFLTKNKKDRFLKKQIQLLQQIRNVLAHTDNAIGNICIRDDECSTLRNTFWQVSTDKNIQSVDNEVDEVKFTNFNHLADYISSIDNLCFSIRQATLQLKRDS